MQRLANVSIDLDGLGCYHAIHGLTDHADPTAIYRVALPRFLDMLDGLGNVRATLFVIASDLEHREVGASLRRAIEAGHEVASHSWRHPYNLRDWSERGIDEEIATAEELLEQHLGVRPVGFRTPGYNVDTRIVRILAERGYRYDSSVFPCPPYYAAKAAVMGAMALTGRPSGSAMTDPAALTAPLHPYRPSRWNFARPGDRKHSLPLWEIPVGVTRLGRAPVIGTTIGACGPRTARALYKAFRLGQRTLQVEFHGIDFMDADDDAIHPALAKVQPDVRRSVADKRAAYEAFLGPMRDEHSMVTLRAMVDQLDAAAGPTVIGGPPH